MQLTSIYHVDFYAKGLTKGREQISSVEILSLGIFKNAKWADQACRVPLQLGKEMHPQNSLPALLP